MRARRIRSSTHEDRGTAPGLARTVLDRVRSPVRRAGTPGLGTDERHEVVQVAAPDTAGILAAERLNVTTMGRSPAEDPDYFAAAGQAGVLGASLLP